MSSHNLAPAVAWFERVAADNTREFWQRERSAYRSDVSGPFAALLAEVDRDASAWKVYRPHNDTRFGSDRGPLKTFIGALRVEPDGTGRYLQLDARGLLASSGMPFLAPDQLPRWRAALLDTPGSAFASAVERATAAGGTLKSGYPEPLVRAPRGVDPEHPRIVWLRWKGVEVYGRHAADAPDAAAAIRSTWDAGAEVCRWLAEHVGPSALERPRR
ncbi:DUF2461 family protein [Microcella daejeonensis]|uniref:DUF2461 family protein n=1 Tax=Microcella daejeonensis TaxID=2994971 RepID=A0A9E8S7Q3_9MICO|nr:DUF2461 family protein [Microcella daejeonensis]WAB80735.1 DUF2461 family protein [Microcella daejeonensis]